MVIFMPQLQIIIQFKFSGLFGIQIITGLLYHSISDGSSFTNTWIGASDIASNNTSFINYQKQGETVGTVFRVVWTNTTTATATELSPNGVARHDPAQIAIVAGRLSSLYR